MVGDSARVECVPVQSQCVYCNFINNAAVRIHSLHARDECETVSKVADSESSAIIEARTVHRIARSRFAERGRVSASVKDSDAEHERS